MSKNPFQKSCQVPCLKYLSNEIFRAYTVIFRDDVPTIFNTLSHLQKNYKPHRAPKDRSVPMPAVSGLLHLPSTEPVATVTTSSSQDNADHPYSMPSPRTLKRHVDEAHQKLEVMQKHLKTSQQKSRRLGAWVHSMKTLISDLKNKQMFSQQGADNLCASFSGPALDLVMSCLKKSSGELVRSYPPELHAFALTLQFYCSKAYDYVR